MNEAIIIVSLVLIVSSVALAIYLKFQENHKHTH